MAHLYPSVLVHPLVLEAQGCPPMSLQELPDLPEILFHLSVQGAHLYQVIHLSPWDQLLTLPFDPSVQETLKTLGSPVLHAILEGLETLVIQSFPSLP